MAFGNRGEIIGSAPLDGENIGGAGSSDERFGGSLDGAGGVDGGIITLNPADLRGDAPGRDEPREPRRRGRPPGSGAKSTSSGGKKKETANLADLAGAFAGIHTLLAHVYGAPEFSLDKREAEEVLSATDQAAGSVGIKVPRWMTASGNMLWVLSNIYGPKIEAYRERVNGKTNAMVAPPVKSIFSAQR